MNNIFLNGLKFIFVDIIGDFIYWPIWWYTIGFKERLIWLAHQIKMTWRSLALGMWLKSMFKPMYADRSVLGRTISIVMRIIILIWKMVWFILWSIITIVAVLIWLLAPVIIIYILIKQLRNF